MIKRIIFLLSFLLCFILAACSGSNIIMNGNISASSEKNKWVGAYWNWDGKTYRINPMTGQDLNHEAKNKLAWVLLLKSDGTYLCGGYADYDGGWENDMTKLNEHRDDATWIKRHIFEFPEWANSDGWVKCPIKKGNGIWQVVDETTIEFDYNQSADPPMFKREGNDLLYVKRGPNDYETKFILMEENSILIPFLN